MLRLDSEINIDIGGFFHWWGAELRAVLPEKIKQLFDESHSVLIVELAEDALNISLMTSEHTRSLGLFELNELGRERLQELQNEKQSIANAEIIIRLPATHGVVTEVFIPEAAAANLKQVLSYELDRYTPFNKDQVTFDFIVLGKDKINNQVKVQLIVVPRQKFDPVLEKIMDWGLHPSCVDCHQLPSITDGFRQNYNLLAEEKRQKKNKTPKIIMLISAMLMLLLFAGVLITPLWMKIKTIEVLRAEADRTEMQALKVNEIKNKIETLYEESSSVISKKSNEPLFVEVLDSLSSLMKDDTWLMYLKYNNNKLNIQGQSPSASALIGSLEKVKYFTNTHFVSPVTQDKRTGLERFQIATEVGAGNSDD